MTELQIKHREYLVSPDWRRRRKAFLLPGSNQCERCKRWRQGRGIHLHHKHYHTLGRESREDVEILCTDCHEIADRERAAEGRARGAAALWDARLDGWASKVHGDDWAQHGDAHEIEEDFEDWLERRGDD